MPSDHEEYWNRRFTEQAWIATADPLLVELAGPLPPGRALDVGIGPGRNSLWLAGCGWRVTALDGSGVAVAQARAAAAAAGLSLDTVHADVGRWSPPKAMYDLVVVANLHLPSSQLQVLFSRLADGLRPGGHLFVVGHDVANLGRHGPPDPELLLTVERAVAVLPPDLVVERLERVLRPASQVGDALEDWAVLAWMCAPVAPGRS
jgi:SAM-dependent methyltransferase